MRRVRGRGLSQLIAEEFVASPNEAPISFIEPNPRQPRTIFNDEALSELADSIREHGILQPLVVRSLGGGHYELVAGERRLRAARIAGLAVVPISVVAAGSQDSLEIALIENLQREDIGPIERAGAYRQLINEFGLTQEQVAERLGKPRSTIANTLRIVRLPPRIVDAIASGLITEGHAKALLSYESPEQQLAMFDQIVGQGLNVRETERSTKKSSGGTRVSIREPLDANLEAIQDALAGQLGAPVKLDKDKSGGTITIRYFGDDDLDRILETIGVRV